MKHTLWHLVLSLVLTLPACGSPIDLGDRYRFPTVGPVEEKGGRTDKLSYTFTASTNCAAIGEMVTFTATLMNLMDVPITITTQPVVDFVISPMSWPEREASSEPVRRWSDTASYPPTIDPVLRPGEERSFHWQWIAEKVYDEWGVKGAQVQFLTGYMESPTFYRQVGGPVLYVDVGRMTGGDSGYGLPCHELRVQ